MNQIDSWSEWIVIVTEISNSTLCDIQPWQNSHSISCLFLLKWPCFVLSCSSHQCRTNSLVFARVLDSHTQCSVCLACSAFESGSLGRSDLSLDWERASGVIRIRFRVSSSEETIRLWVDSLQELNQTRRVRWVLRAQEIFVISAHVMILTVVFDKRMKEHF